MAVRIRRPFAPSWATGSDRFISQRGSVAVPRAGRIEDPRPGQVAFNCDELDLFFEVQLNTAGGQPISGGPRYEVAERVLRMGVPEYTGHEPMRMSISMLLDGYPHISVTPSISYLDQICAYNEELRRPPRFDVKGDVPYRYNWQWVAEGYPEWDNDPEPIRQANGDLVRQPLTINLLQVVPDEMLRWSVGRSKAKGRGSKARVHKVRAGENDLGDVAQHVYKNRARAAELARLNGWPVYRKLKVGQKVRLV